MSHHSDVEFCSPCRRIGKLTRPDVYSWDYEPMCAYHADMVEISPSGRGDENYGWNPDQD